MDKDDVAGASKVDRCAWRSMDSAPRDGSAILVWSAARGGCWIAKYEPVYVSGYRPDNPWFCLMLNADWHPGRRTAGMEPTHWMPLPEAPGAASPASQATPETNKPELDATMQSMWEVFRETERAEAKRLQSGQPAPQAEPATYAVLHQDGTVFDVGSLEDMQGLACLDHGETVEPLYRAAQAGAVQPAAPALHPNCDCFGCEKLWMQPAADALTTDQRYWLERRGAIIAALAVEGLEIWSDKGRVWLHHIRGTAPKAAE